MALEEKASGDAYINEKAENENEEDEKIDMGDDSKVKFINGDATPDAVVIVEPSAKNEADFAGMGKEELLKFADDPYWVKVRLAIFILFWVAWFGMLAAAIVIIVLAPKCPPRPTLDWWQTGVMYQVYPRSFQDSNGDGMGDIKGIQEQLPYLKDLGVKTLVISSIFKSGEKDFGMDVTDFMDVDPSLGKIGCFEKLAKDAKKKRMKVILDIAPHSTGKTHEWFVASAKDKAGEYGDYYIWAASPQNWKTGDPPVNVWVEDTTRGESYLASLGADRPILNLKNPKVQEEIKKIMSFWMDKGADGFRVLDVSNIAGDQDTSESTFKMNTPLAYNLTKEWKELMNEYYKKTDRTRVLMVEPVGTKNETLDYFRDSDMPINKNLLKLDAACKAKCILGHIETFISSLPSGKWANWLTGTIDTKRVVTRMGGDQMVSAVNSLLMTLPGTPIGYYGEEIGMKDVAITLPNPDPFKLGSVADLATKYQSRTPMQWSSEANAGFTVDNATTWLPIADNYKKYNVKSEQAAGSSIDFIDVYKQLTKLREKPSMMWGKFMPAAVSNDILSYVRQAEGHPGFLVSINFGKDASTNDYTKAVGNLVPAKGVVVFNSMNFKHEDFKIGEEVDLSNVLLNPGEAVVFEIPWSQK